MSRVMLVTGASRGIGAAVARLAAAAGYTVVVNYASNKDAAAAVIDEIGNDSFATQADVAVESASREGNSKHSPPTHLAPSCASSSPTASV